MLVSLNWLKNYIDVGSHTPEELSELITKSGIEVDGIKYVAEKSKGVVVGHVVSCEKHPNADKLNLCQVDIGEEQLQIICGAPNIAAGQKVAVATPGAVLPGNFKIKKVKLRGVESNGMICSLQELGISEEFIQTEYAKGIFVFPEDTEIGQEVTSLLNLDDAILEFDLTPNRSDCLSMFGVAHEVSAIINKPITFPDETLETAEEKAVDRVSIGVDVPDLAPYYAGFLIKDLEIKESPLWLRNYLMAAGIRPINNVVDITNYVLMEYGQPLHAFDFDLLQTDKIVVRLATENEKIITLDDKERTLTTDNLVITDGEVPVALAGVMGGANTEVNDQTKTILLEAAYFDPATVRKNAQLTGIRSEASTRLEKGVDPDRVYRAGIRACQLLQKYANGVVLAEPAVFDQLDRSEKSIEIEKGEVNKRLGTDISSEEIEKILTKLQFAYKRDAEQFQVSIPTRRGDISIFEDMLEEIARIHGYDNLPYTLPTSSSRPGGLTNRQLLKRKVKNYLQGVGLMETITYSLTKADFVDKLISPEIAELDTNPVSLLMPMSEDHKYLRVSLLPELLGSTSYNHARKHSNVALYEVGSVFLSQEETLTTQPDENLRAAGVLTGTWIDHKWQQNNKKVDFYVAKGIVDGLFQYLDLSVTYKQSQVKDMHPGRCATLHIGEEVVGFVGQVHPQLAKNLDLKDTYVFDINLESILEKVEIEPSYDAIPRYPSVTRDIAFVMDQDVEAGAIKAVIEENGASIVKQVEIFDVYTGENLPEDKKSIAYSLHFQHPEHTLTDEEVEAVYQDIIAKVNEAFSAYVRS
ncbi:phenylalanine--tRNA ligase subunit beta [Ornithinibacillus sp. 4-3]|uniref:Phenylalanine--tRNA ligase beta subunit n=1 Tax=Ornithinibacillus sp. 4-3 TaxID=3231488 RepID=A0AB39HMR9_9BACI